MIDPKTPLNDLPLLPPKNFAFDDKEILIESISTSRAIASLNATIRADEQNIAHSLNLMSPLFVPEAVASSGVENIITTNESIYQKQLFDDGEVSPQDKEVMRYIDALWVGLEELRKNKFLSTNQYLAIQKTLEPTKHGLRKLPGTQLSNPKTGVVYYTPPVGEDLIRSLLKDYETYFNAAAPDHEIFCRAAILHYQFEAIHPFYDGNGRTGRMLIPLYLTKHGVLEAPLLFTSKYILDHRDDYYRLLREVTFKNAWKPWVIYVLKALRIQAKYTLDILQRIQIVQKQLSEKVQVTIGHSYSREVSELLFSQPYFTHALFQEALGVTYVTSGKYLGLLEKEGIIVKKRQPRRNRYLYACPGYIKLLRDA